MQPYHPLKPSIWQSPVAILSAITLLIFLVPSVVELFVLDWSLVFSGEIWRLFTGHLTHWDGGHLFWDLSMFTGLGMLCERRSVSRTAVSIVGSMLAISLAIATVHPEIQTYRGLSGVDSGLFVLLLTNLFVDAIHQQDLVWKSLAGLGLVSFLGKIAFEVASGRTLFVDSAAGGFEPLPSAHLIGAIVGFLVAFLPAEVARTEVLRRASSQAA